MTSSTPVRKYWPHNIEEKFGKAGVQSVILGNTFLFDVESEEFVQVLHDGHA